jgi:hypothetical protein
MSKWLKVLFLVHAVVALVFGAPLLLVPGRFETWLQRAPIDPIVSRLLGAALLGMAWASFRAWSAREWSQVALLVELGVVFDGLACLGLLRHLTTANYPVLVWALFGLFLAFTLAWLVVLLPHVKR